MTALAIIPNYDKKRLKLVGTVAAGEHVAVTVVGGADWIGEGKSLRLRAIFGNKTVAKFPYWTEENEDDWPESVTEADAWTADGDDATCEFVLNTVPAEKMLRFGGTCLLILDDIETHTLYGASEISVEPWPKHCGADTPYSLDEYPDFVKEAKEAIAGFAIELQSLGTAQTAHEGDSVRHITAAERALWNGKANQTDLNAEAAARAAADATEARDRAAADNNLQTNKADRSEVYTKDETDDAIEGAIADLVDGAPEALDTLKEVADWIADDQSGAAAMAADIAALQSGKVDKVVGKGLSTEDFTSAEKAKLAGIGEGADANVQPDWAQTDSTQDDYIKNKPTIPAAVTVDSAMSGTSENPVQNKVVKTAIDAKYALPSGGIPKTDLANAVQTSLGKADTALQAHQELRYAMVAKTVVAVEEWSYSDAQNTYGYLPIHPPSYEPDDQEPGWQLIMENPENPGVADVYLMKDTSSSADATTLNLVGVDPCPSGASITATLTATNVVTLDDRAVNTVTPASGASFTVEMGALPSGVSGKARDAVLVIDCSLLSEGDEPTVTWGVNFHPRTDAGTDFACVAGAKNVYYISEYASGEFAVGGWTETAGGNA